MLTPKIDDDSYRAGLKHSNGGTARQLLEQMEELHELDRKWEPTSEQPDRPDYEGKAFSMMIGFLDGIINRLRR